MFEKLRIKVLERTHGLLQGQVAAKRARKKPSSTSSREPNIPEPWKKREWKETANVASIPSISGGTAGTTGPMSTMYPQRGYDGRVHGSKPSRPTTHEESKAERSAATDLVSSDGHTFALVDGEEQVQDFHPQGLFGQSLLSLATRIPHRIQQIQYILGGR